MKRTIICLLVTAAFAASLFAGVGCSGQEAKTGNLDAGGHEGPPTGGRVGKNSVNWKTGE